MAMTNPAHELRILQDNQKNIRNICILAHVDHGKTTLADSLIASNGIISKRQAGKMRYMDSREDEQFRGITMKSSAIALKYIKNDDSYLINLIDSPGHVDFSSEVSTAVRLCDGAIVVVDVVEGVCPQTQMVLEQAWQEGIKPCLVLNKMDRLIVELRKTSTEAYYHIQQVLQQVNVVTATLWTTELMQQANDQQQSTSKRSNSTSDDSTEVDQDILYNWDIGLHDKDDSTVYFCPEQGNVIFSSATCGWGFGIEHFAKLYSTKLGMRDDVLRKTLWGDFYLDAKTKRIHKGAYAKGKKPLFVQFILDNIWSVYDAVLLNKHKDKQKIEKITRTLGLKISLRDLSNADRNVHLFAICSQWLPLADAVLDMVTSHLPSPLELSKKRVEKLMCNNEKAFKSFPLETQKLREDFLSCQSGSESPTILFISKMFHVDPSALPQNKGRSLTQEELLSMREAVKEKVLAKFPEGSQTTEKLDSEDDSSIAEASPTIDCTPMFLAFARVFSGTIHKNQDLYVLHPRYDPSELKETFPSCENPLHTSKFKIQDLYLLMGREVLEVESVAAGNILGIGGLGELVLKSATLSSTLACPAFRSMHFAASPIVHVAIEPMHPVDMPQLVKGMKLLNQADPCVEITVQETGEHILSTAGEVHLQRCIDDLRDHFARVQLNVSSPIVPFRETIVPLPKIDMVNEAISSENEIKRVTNPLLGDEIDITENMVTISTPNKSCSLKIQATPLQEEVIKILEENEQLLKSLMIMHGRDRIQLNDEVTSQMLELKAKMEACFATAGKEWVGVVNKIMAFGPRHTGPNILVNGINDYSRPSIWVELDLLPKDQIHELRDYDNSIVSGFQLASLSGPLCEEPLHGVCFTIVEWNMKGTVSNNGKKIEKLPENFDEGEQVNTENTKVFHIKVEEDSDSDEVKLKEEAYLKADAYGPFSGQLMSTMKEGCRKAFLLQPARLMAAMYSCDIQATASVLGQVYAVIGRRGGRVICDEMVEGSEVFLIKALIPVAESFGFAKEIRTRTSGLANPQLIFSHWEIIQSDPFWVPSTEEELLHYGEKADSDSLARRYINDVRRRKGLSVEEKLVEHAEKQRTLKKNK